MTINKVFIGQTAHLVDPVTGTAIGPSGITASASFTPAATGYDAGDIIATAQEFVFYDSNNIAVPAGSLVRILTSVMKIGVTSVPSGQTSYTLQAYGATPTGTPQADNAVWAAAAGDQTIYKGPIPLGTPADIGAFLYVKTQYQDFDIRLDSGKDSIFGQLVTAGAFTATAVARQVTLHAVYF